MFRNFTLPIKFSLFSLFMTLTGIAIALSATFYQSDTLLRQQALERLSDDVQREQTLLDSRLRTLVDDIHFLVSSAAMQGIVRASRGDGYDDQENMTSTMWQGRLMELFSTMLQQRAAYVSISLIELDVPQPMQLRIERQGDNLQRRVGAPPVDDSMQHAIAQAAALAPAENFISPVELERADGRLVFPPRSLMRIATPVYSREGFFGVAIISVDFDSLLHTLYEAPEHMEYFLTNAQGQYLIHSDPDRRMAFEQGPGPSGRLQADYGDLLGTQNNQWHLLQRYLPDAQAGLAIQRYRFAGVQRGDVEFWLGARAELALLSSQSDALKDDIILLAVLLVAGVTLGTVLIGNALTRPILALRDAADRITAGERKVDLDIRGNDEVASLAHSLGTMLAHLQTSREDLASLNRSLEDKVSTRTVELENAKSALEGTNEELARALQETEQAAVAKSQFLANMSHEIRTPLNGVLGMAELLMNTPLDDRQRGYLETVKTSGNTLLNLLNDILDFSKLEAGKLNLSEVKFNPNDVVEHSLQLFVELAHSKGLELIPMTMPTLPNLLLGDPDRLGQVLMNLVSNAIKFTEEGEVVLSVSCPQETDHHMTLRFSVVDTGIGIAADQQARLFEKFVQADGTSTRKHGGTGLGLAISKQLVDLMGGDIQLQSEPGAGTTIWFDIQLKKGPRQKFTDEAQALVEGKRVLVVDDNKTNRDLLHQMTESWGMVSTRAADASTAIHQMVAAAERGSPIELVLLDHMMPGTNGLELARELSQTPAFNRPPILLLTSISDQLSESVLASAGIASMMTKPLRQSLLYNQIIYCLEGSAQVQPEPVSPSAPALPTPVPEGGAEARILLVEDTPLNQRVAMGMLATLGYSAELVCNGKQAVEKVQAQRYDLVLMDVEMPILDGLQATRDIRLMEADAGVPATPVVALTAHALKGDRDKCLAAGMNDYLSKPLTMDALRVMLERWLKVQATGAESDVSRMPCPQQGAEVQVVLDADVLAQLKAGLGDDIDDVLHIFLQEWPQLLAGLQHHLAEGQAEQLRMLAHRLKGSCRNLGATRLADLAQAIEQAAAEAQLDVVQPHIDTLISLDAATVIAVQAQLSRVEVQP